MLHKKFFTSLIVLVAGISWIAAPLHAHAASFNPHYILSDSVFRNGTSFSVSNIQSFLQSKGSGLAGMTVMFNGSLKSIAQIISDSSKTYNINPKVLLTMIQKEQGAIEDSSLSSYQLNLLLGYNPWKCANDPGASVCGAANQIDAAAWQLDRYFSQPNNYGYKVGQEKTTEDGVKVKPQNQSTANLFNYNPVAGNDAGSSENEVGNGGNFLFWKLWLSYFATKYPDGVLVQVKGEPAIYLLKNGKRWAFWSKKIFTQSYSNMKVVQVGKGEIDAYPLAGPVKFNDGTLIRAKNGGVFVITDGNKKPIPSPNALKLLGYAGKPIIDVTDVELSIHPQVAKFNESHLVRQNGALVKIKEKPGVYLIEKGKKRPIWSSYIRSTRFQNVTVIDISQAELNQYPLGSPVEFRDGTIIRDSQKNLFAIAKGKRYKIDNTGVLGDLNMSNYPIVDVSNSLRDAQPLGGNLTDLN